MQRFHGTTWPFVAMVPMFMGCSVVGDVTVEERAILSTFVMNAPPPDHPTNAWADDPAAAELGQKLFFDSRFSGPLLTESDLGHVGDVGRVACATCHDPADGGSDHRSAGATSHGASWTGRNAPTVLNSAYLEATHSYFWDGRKDTLWSQALGPPESAGEHNSSRLHMAHLTLEHYQQEYEAIFGPLPDLRDETRFPALATVCDDLTCWGRPGDEVWNSLSEADQHEVDLIFVNYGKATAAYERLLVTPDTPFDQYMRGEGALSDAAIRGAKLFVGRASCDECHRGPTFSDGAFHNLGAPQGDSPFVPEVDVGREVGIGLLLADPFNAATEWSDAPDASGHLDRLGEPDDARGQFKTPTLRNVANTGPYMHSGAYRTLWDVLDFYRFGGRNDNNVGQPDPEMNDLLLSDDDLQDLIAFLESLTDDSLPDHLVEPPQVNP